ncbi:MAG: protein kinase [Planctomycetota bacterium]
MYDATGTQGTNAQMLYTCPHCQGRFEFNTESLVRQIFCPLCGQGFDPVKIETMRYPEGTPVSPSPGAAPETIQAANKDERLRVGTLLGQFRIDEFIGRGGMGAVYKATQTSLDRSVALKVLPRHMAEDPEFVQRFHREAKALAELNHPNIVSIYDKGNEDGQYFFAMEFVDGVSLRHLIKSKTVSPAQALALVPQLCEALEYAHSRGVIHRDIKPENILVDRSGRVKIADFGLARILRGDNATSFDGLTRSDVMMGTVNYMAPEQRENAKDVDHRADIYSLGVVIYELLTGELPIGRFAAPSKKVQIDVRFDEVVLQLLEKDREDRYQNVSDVKTGFARVMSEPPTPVEREPRVAAPAEPAMPWWVRALPGGFLGVFGTVLAAAGIHLLAQPGTPMLGLMSLLVGLAGLAASFSIDHGRPAPGQRVSAAETAGGFLMLGLGLLAVGGFLVNATVAREGFMKFWATVGGWVYLAVSVVVFVGFEGLSSHLKVRSERGRWTGTIVNVMNLAIALLGFALVRAVPSRPDELAFQLTLAYPFAAAAVFGAGWWAAGKGCESECPILDKGVSIEANCPSGAGVRIQFGTSAPPVPSTPSSSVPPQAAATIPGVPLAEEIKAQVRAAIAEIPSAEEIKAQVRASLQASGIPAMPAAFAPSEKALRKGWNKTRAMWRDALWHAGAYAIIAGGFALAGRFGWWLFFWGCVVGGQLLSTLFRTIANPPHRLATTPQAQKRRKELSGFLQHLTWFAAITTGFAYPEMQLPWWAPWWGIGLAFHFLSTILDVSFGKDGA